MKLKTEYKVGLVGVLTIALLYLGIAYLKGQDIFNVETNYYTVFNNVEGLYKSNYVYLNGMKVGYIKDIQNMDAHGDKFLVKVSIKSDIVLSEDSRIAIFSSDLLGSKALKIIPGRSSVLYQKQDTIPTIAESGFMDQMSQNLAPAVLRLNSVMANLDTLLVNVNNVMDSKTQANIRQSMENIKLATANINRISLEVDGLMDSEKKKIQKIISNTESITSNFKDNNEKLTSAINNFNAISDTIAKAKLGNTIRETNMSLTSLSNILQKIERGEGSVGLLLKDDKLYNNIESSTKKLDDLILDIKTNPKKYVTIRVF